eukprot:UN31688
MLKCRVPKQSILNKMKQDGIDPARFPELEGKPKKGVTFSPVAAVPVTLSKPSSDNNSSNNNDNKPKEIPKELKKYARMLKMNIPKNAVQNKMKQDGLDPSRICEIDGTPPKPAAPPAASNPQEPAPIPKELQKYAKMLKMRLPPHVIKNKMKIDGIDPNRT